MVAEPTEPLMSVEAYLALDRSSYDARYEYLAGRVHLMAGGTLNHDTLMFTVRRLLYDRLRGGPCQTHGSDARVQLDERHFVYPDVSVSCDERDRGTTDMVRTPRVIVEVLSPSTALRDYAVKADAYRGCATIEEYVLVDAQQIRVEVQRRVGGLWKLLTFTGGQDVELASLGVTIPLGAIYEDVRWDAE